MNQDVQNEIFPHMKSDVRNIDTVVRILIADSSHLFRQKMKQMIADKFHSILTSEACNEQEVLNEISRHAFDILMLDLDLSDCNGLNVLKKIMIINPDIRVLVMSMFPVEQYEESVFRAGAYGYVSKVTLPDELITALHDIRCGKKHFGCRFSA